MQASDSPGSALSLRNADAVDRDGFVAPFPLFSREECHFIRRHLQFGEIPKPLLWDKGRFATDRVLYDLAIRPALLAFLRRLLGEDIILWGVNVLVRNPGDEHPWHTDIESSAPDGRFISVWVGVQNSSRTSTLNLISRSHLFGKTFQEVASHKGYRRGEPSDDMVLNWAQEIDSHSALVQPAISDGECIVFDGRLWHGSAHRAEGQRVALLFQYTTAGTAVSIPDLAQLEWPFRYKAELAPAILVSGSVEPAATCVMPPETEDNRILAEVHSLRLPLPEDKVTRWRPHHLFRGATPNTQVMGAHVSVLSTDHSPHPPHAHREEELLIVLDGQAELIIADSPDDANPRVEQLEKGSFVYYPAYQHHTIRNRSGRPITYLMFKWRGQLAAGEEKLATMIINAKGEAGPISTLFSAVKLFEGPTAYLYKLHSHLSVLQPRAGYASHTDQHDVAIVVLSGRVQTMQRVVEPHGVIFYAAGEMHDMKNVGDTPACYLVFEFHKSGGSDEAPLAIFTEQPIPPTPEVLAMTADRASVKKWIASFRQFISRSYNTHRQTAIIRKLQAK